MLYMIKTNILYGVFGRNRLKFTEKAHNAGFVEERAVRLSTSSYETRYKPNLTLEAFTAFPRTGERVGMEGDGRRGWRRDRVGIRVRGGWEKGLGGGENLHPKDGQVLTRQR